MMLLQQISTQKLSLHTLKTPTVIIDNKSDLLIAHEDWSAILETGLSKDSAAVEFLARLLFTIKETIDNAPDGIEQASRALSAGIESAYLYTDAHRSAFELYLLSLAGHLKPQDEPLQLINEAITRSAVEDKLRKKNSASKKKRRSLV